MTSHPDQARPAGTAPQPGTRAHTPLETPATAMKRALIYTRTRTGDHARYRNQQLQACRAEATRRNLIIVATVHDRGPATTSVARPGWSRVTELIEAGQVDYIVCADFTRITRDWGDIPGLLNLLRKHGVDIVSLAQRFEDPAESSPLPAASRAGTEHRPARGEADSSPDDTARTKPLSSPPEPADPADPADPGDHQPGDSK